MLSKSGELYYYDILVYIETGTGSKEFYESILVSRSLINNNNNEFYFYH